MSSLPSKAFYIAAILALNPGPAVALGSDSAQAISSDQLAPELVADADDPWLRPGLVTEWTGDLDPIIDRGFLRLLTVPNKTQYFVDGARERGTTAETALALEKMINAKLPRKEHITVVTIPVQRDQLIPMLNQGLGDIAIGSLTITPERRKIVDFSIPIAKNIREVVVTAAATNPITTLEDLSGREVWVRQSSSYHETLTTLSRKLESEGRSGIDIRLASETLEDEDLLEMVNAGLYPATVVDSHKIEMIWKDVLDQLIVSSVAIFDNGEIGAAIRKDSPLLKESLDEFYREHRVGTAFGNILVKRYHSDSRWIRNVNASEDRRRFDAVVDIFKQYSQQYDFDYMMMIAQGYQESRLNQDVKSPVGAIGIMQLMPETAAGSPLFMPDVSTPDKNIHAGIKYMRYIMDTYLADPGLAELDRYMFAFASYNAGPNRIARLRKLAPEYGLNPNRWFKNVQYMVASKVGQEPVKYVNNINKYYLAYSRIQELGKGAP